jgi:hypothetical protein
LLAGCSVNPIKRCATYAETISVAKQCSAYDKCVFTLADMDKLANAEADWQNECVKVLSEY